MLNANRIQGWADVLYFVRFFLLFMLKYRIGGNRKIVARIDDMGWVDDSTVKK